jgi:hypothetical protein
MRGDSAWHGLGTVLPDGSSPHAWGQLESSRSPIQHILDELKPETVYFTEYQGCRGAIMIINLEDPSKVLTFAEPWFLLFNADCEFHVVMTSEDLAKAGLDNLGKKWF